MPLDTSGWRGKERRGKRYRELGGVKRGKAGRRGPLMVALEGSAPWWKLRKDSVSGPAPQPPEGYLRGEASCGAGLSAWRTGAVGGDFPFLTAPKGTEVCAATTRTGSRCRFWSVKGSSGRSCPACRPHFCPVRAAAAVVSGHFCPAARNLLLVSLRIYSYLEVCYTPPSLAFTSPFRVFPYPVGTHLLLFF